MPKFHFDLVSPEKLVFSGEVEQVDVPGSEGDFGVLAAHAPMVTTLRPGVLVIHTAEGAQRLVVNSGFVEIGPEGMTVLADMAVAPDALDPARLAEEISDTEDDIADTKDDALRDRLVRRLEQLRGVQAVLGH
jgi:F-type H+-transporting ATPase subunit epsilon